MRLLWIATKPPLPPIDGGRLVAATTLAALAEQGVEIDLVAPVPRLTPSVASGPRARRPALQDPTVPLTEAHTAAASLATFCNPHLIPVSSRSKLGALVRSALSRRPFSIVRHEHEEVRRRVAELVASRGYDAVHVEQVQALAQAEPALRRGLPVVLRAQNVESDLWRWDEKPRGRRGEERGDTRNIEAVTIEIGGHATPAGVGEALLPAVRSGMAWETRRLAAFEGRAVRRVTTTVTLSTRDAERLRELAGPGAHVVTVPPPFAATLPAGGRPLPGEPPLILMGSGGWLPNRDANLWFLSAVWKEIRAQVSGAVLHLFAPAGERPPVPAGVTAHDPPADSADAFAPGGILVVPLRVGSGVRMKILEAWARGLCVVATPEAVAGLEARDGRELLVARDAAGFAAAIRRLAEGAGLQASLIAAGRRALIEHHDPAAVARRLLALYATAAPTT